VPVEKIEIKSPLNFEFWKKTNVYPQKQDGYLAVYVRVANGNISSESSRSLIEKLRPVIADDIRITINQGLQFRYVKPEHLEYIYSVLEQEGLASPGFGSVADITACPGTDTCNLGISNSTGISEVLSEVVEEEFPEFLYNKDIAIKISGCMNSCGQHGMASIGFHGSSLKAKGQVLPALQVLIGGGVLGSGEGSMADKVLKVPSKRGPDVLRSLLNDFKANRQNEETYLQYTKRVGEKYFYELLKPLASLDTLLAEDYIDWGQEEKYATAIGVGECAGVMIDLVATLILEGEEKLELSRECLDKKAYADGIYNAYAAFVHTAKALLLQYGVQCNTQAGILRDFDTHFTQKGQFTSFSNFKERVLQINESEPSEQFANAYLQQAKDFVTYAKQHREQAVLAEKEA
jgi:sulfite reductase (ferredoxin)